MVNARRVSARDLNAASAQAASEQDYAGLWVDYLAGQDLDRGGASALGLEVLWSSESQVSNLIELGVIAAGPDAQEALDDRYGIGAVRLVPTLKPVREE